MIDRWWNYCVEAYDMPLSNSWLTFFNCVTTVVLCLFAVYAVSKFRHKLNRTDLYESKLVEAARLAVQHRDKAADLLDRLEEAVKKTEAAAVNYVKATTEAYRILELASRSFDRTASLRNDVVEEVKELKKTVERVPEAVATVVSPPPPSGTWKKGDVDRRHHETNQETYQESHQETPQETKK